MQAIDALLTRRSARTLSDPGPDAAALDLMFAAAARAPDHGRLRPWRFIVIEGEARVRFGELLADHLRRSHPGAGEETVQRERQKAFRAPLLVVVAAAIVSHVKVPAVEQIITAGAAAHSMMLAACALGFNAMWKTGAPAYDATVKSALGLAAADAIVGFLYIGSEASPVAQPADYSWRDRVVRF
jgi:nitroreductase